LILEREVATLCCEDYNEMRNTVWARGRIFERIVTAGLYSAKRLFYEGWNFNSGNYLFTTDTK